MAKNGSEMVVELCDRVCKLESLFKELAKWTNFQIPSETTPTHTPLNNQLQPTFEEFSELEVENEVDFKIEVEDIEDNYDAEENADFLKDEDEDFIPSGCSDANSSQEQDDETLRRKTRNTRKSSRVKVLPSTTEFPNPHVSLKRLNPQQLEQIKTTPIKKKRKVKKYQCPHCPVKTPSMKWHLRVHTDERPFPCPHCSYGAKTTTHLKQHLGIMHPEDPLAPPTFKCPKCPKAFRVYAYLQQHLTRHWEKTMLCHHCPFTSKTQKDLNVHIKSKHESTGNEENVFSCYFCSKTFKQKSFLFGHIRRHTGENPIKCPKCDFATSDYIYKYNHMKMKHPEDESGGWKALTKKAQSKKKRSTEEKKYPCPHCEASYNGLNSLSWHLNEVHGAKTPGMMKCSICPYEALNRVLLREHVRKEHPKGEANYHCNACPKKFKQKHHLRDHLNFHAGLKPFKCPFCPVAFGTPSNLHQHKKICQGRDNQTENEGA